MSSINLTHHFLIAMPSMADPYFAKTLTYVCEHNEQGALGVAWRSVRREGGHCVGLFKPRAAKACLHAALLLYAWDGARFSDIYEKLDA